MRQPRSGTSCASTARIMTERSDGVILADAHGVERWTSPTTQDVARNLASSKLRDTSGGRRIRRGAGGRLSERSEVPSPDRAAARPRAEGDSPDERSESPRHARSACTQAVRAWDASQSRRKQACRRNCPGFSPRTSLFHIRGTGTQLPPLHRQQCMLVLSLKGPSL